MAVEAVFGGSWAPLWFFASPLDIARLLLHD
jgi:hypothetical protein